jgi:hypothetical protein
MLNKVRGESCLPCLLLLLSVSLFSGFLLRGGRVSERQHFSCVVAVSSDKVHWGTKGLGMLLPATCSPKPSMNCGHIINWRTAFKVKDALYACSSVSDSTRHSLHRCGRFGSQSRWEW